MDYLSAGDFMQQVFEGAVSRAEIVRALFTNSDIAAIASEHGVDRDALVAAVSRDESSIPGAYLRDALIRMRASAGIPRGTAFPERLERATDGGLELIGLHVNPLMTTALILGRPIPPLRDAARAIDPSLSLAAYASRIFRVLAVQHPPFAIALSNAAAALERA